MVTDSGKVRVEKQAPRPQLWWNHPFSPPRLYSEEDRPASDATRVATCCHWPEICGNWTPLEAGRLTKRRFPLLVCCQLLYIYFCRPNARTVRGGMNFMLVSGVAATGVTSLSLVLHQHGRCQCWAMKSVAGAPTFFSSYCLHPIKYPLVQDQLKLVPHALSLPAHRTKPPCRFLDTTAIHSYTFSSSFSAFPSTPPFPATSLALLTRDTVLPLTYRPDRVL